MATKKRQKKFVQPEEAGLLEKLAAGAQLGGLISGNQTVGAVGGGLMDSIGLQQRQDFERGQQTANEAQVRAEADQNQFNSDAFATLANKKQGSGGISTDRMDQIKLLADQGDLKGAKAAFENALKTPELVSRQTATATFRNSLKQTDLQKIALGVATGKISPQATDQEIADLLGKPLDKVEKSDVSGRAKRAGVTADEPGGGVQGFFRGITPDAIESPIAQLFGGRSADQFSQDQQAAAQAASQEAIAQATALSPADPQMAQQQAIQQALGQPQTQQAAPQLQPGERVIRRQADGAIFIQGADGSVRPAN